VQELEWAANGATSREEQIRPTRQRRSTKVMAYDRPPPLPQSTKPGRTSGPRAEAASWSVPRDLDQLADATPSEACRSDECAICSERYRRNHASSCVFDARAAIDLTLSCIEEASSETERDRAADERKTEIEQTGHRRDRAADEHTRSLDDLRRRVRGGATRDLFNGRP